MQPKYAKFDGNPKSDDSGHQVFDLKNGMVFKFEILSTMVSSSRTIDETQLCSEVASRPRRGRWVARLSVARLQSSGAGSGLESEGRALGAHLSGDTDS